MKSTCFYVSHRLLNILFLFSVYTGNAQSIEFNTSIIDAEDKENIDFSRFSSEDYIMPGRYILELRVNDHNIIESHVDFYERAGDKDADNKVEACLTKEQIDVLGLTPTAREKITWWRDSQCADLSELKGALIRTSLAESALLISMPQNLLEYQDATWLPPSRWEDGVPGVMLDYSINSSATHQLHSQRSQDVSANGSLGANYDAWRLRGDWQANYAHTTGSGNGSTRTFDWSRLYAFRALKGINARLSVGEDYLSSDIFSSWRYTGLSITSDDRMLPPNLRGYAPEVTGIARTNAKVTITQQGRTIYETTVAAGAFRIQDIRSSVSGQLDVRVEEQDGSVQSFQVDTASVPYMTRPGKVRYKFYTGRPSDFDHHLRGPEFAVAEMSWGISNAWSLYGGAIVGGSYNALAAGIARDMMKFGTISVDVTRANSTFPHSEDQTGQSWRMSYSKRFDQINSQISFAGYRFSDESFLSMSEYLDRRYSQQAAAHSKEMYTVTANKNFADRKASVYLTWTHQTYWDRQDSDRYSLSFSKYFDVGQWHNISTTLSAMRTNYNGKQDDGIYLSMSLPFGDKTLSYSGNWTDSRDSQSVGVYQRVNERDSYRLNAGIRDSSDSHTASQFMGYYSHNGEIADITANAGWVQDEYTSFGLSVAGGMTATANGAALHPGGGRGSTRMMVSTDGVAGIPIQNYEKTNAFGIAVVPDVNSYYRNSTWIDVNHLPDDAEANGSPVTESFLTEGAIGFRHFEILQGAKIMAVLRLEDGRFPPFGASIQNSAHKEVGMVSDAGLSWISGVRPEEVLNVIWGQGKSCRVNLPAILTGSNLLLPCI